jgi:hypothetical protein
MAETTSRSQEIVVVILYRRMDWSECESFLAKGLRLLPLPFESLVGALSAILVRFDGLCVRGLLRLRWILTLVISL